MTDKAWINPFRVGGYRWVGSAERKRLNEEEAKKEQLAKERFENAKASQAERQCLDLELWREDRLRRQRLEQAQAEKEQLEKKRLEKEEAELPRPFNQTRLGKLPGEIRTMIYEHVLVIPSSFMMTRYGPTLRDSNLDTPEDILQSTQFISEGPKEPPATATLQVCRQIVREAYHIFYEKNTLYFETAQELRDFLVHIGPGRRPAVRAIHIDRLLTPVRLWSDADLEEIRISQPWMTAGQHERYARATHNVASMESREVSELCMDCTELPRISFNLEAIDGMTYVLFLLDFVAYGKAQVDFVDHGHWHVVKSDCSWYWQAALTIQLRELKDGESLFGIGNHRVEVTFAKDLKRKRYTESQRKMIRSGW